MGQVAVDQLSIAFNHRCGPTDEKKHKMKSKYNRGGFVPFINFLLETLSHDYTDFSSWFRPLSLGSLLSSRQFLLQFCWLVTAWKMTDPNDEEVLLICYSFTRLDL